MNKTRHLDNAIQILGNSNPLVKRQRAPAVQVTVHHDPKKNDFLVQVGSRIVASGAGDREVAKRVGEDQVRRLAALGKKAVLIVY